MSRTATFRIVHVSAHQVGGVLALTLGLAGLPFGLFTQIPRWMAGAVEWMVPGCAALFAILGFLFGWLAAAAYNGMAARGRAVEWTVRLPARRVPASGERP